MKSSFLLLLILSSLITTLAWGQTKKPVKATAVPAAAPAASAEPSKSAFDKFYERLSIGYFGAYSSPTLKDWDSRYAAISKEFDRTHRDSYSHNVWSQVNFAYNYGGKFKFNIIPRWTTFLDEVGNNKGGNQDNGSGNRGMIIAEDMLVGFSGTLYSSTDKKFNWWIRPGLRLPTARSSKNQKRPDLGRLSHQTEFLNSFSYDFNKDWQLALTYQARFWHYEDRYNWARMRNYIAPYFTYTINDKTKFQGYYEVMLQNDAHWKSVDGEKIKWEDKWQNAYVGITYDVTPKLNIAPYFNVFVNDAPITMESAWISVWISYTIK